MISTLSKGFIAGTAFGLLLGFVLFLAKTSQHPTQHAEIPEWLKDELRRDELIKDEMRKAKLRNAQNLGSTTLQDVDDSDSSSSAWSTETEDESPLRQVRLRSAGGPRWRPRLEEYVEPGPPANYGSMQTKGIRDVRGDVLGEDKEVSGSQ